MTKRPVPRPQSPLAAAALAVDAELERFEALAAAAMRVPLDSQKNVDRAARANNDAAAAQQRLGALLQTFMKALADAREQNARTADELAKRTAAIQARADEAAALVQRFSALAERARDAIAAVKAVPQDAPGPARTAAEAQLGALAAAEAQLGALAADADALFAAARAAGFPELESQADSLRQKTHASLKKVAHAREELESRG
jgi:ABC-type transporter Mla subunit MlaD